MRRDPWQALADPTRREILGLLAEDKHTINEIANHFTVTRPAISKQIKILRECGLIDVLIMGRERLCTLNPSPLQEVSEWISHYEKFWLGRLDRLGEYLDDES